jgi:hypothetical protein
MSYLSLQTVRASLHLGEEQNVDRTGGFMSDDSKSFRQRVCESYGPRDSEGEAAAEIARLRMQTAKLEAACRDALAAWRDSNLSPGESELESIDQAAAKFYPGEQLLFGEATSRLVEDAGKWKAELAKEQRDG